MAIMLKQNYRHSDEVPGSCNAAERIVPIILQLQPTINSVVDVGGGTGAWLRHFQQMGVQTIQLYDAAEVLPELLIEPSCFCPVNLNECVPPPTRFDMAVCVECAEHLRADRALPLVKWLTDTADIVVFSAAVPGQGGKGHINTQSPEYWQDLFWRCGYVRHDVLRKSIIADGGIPYWYRQNLFVFTNPDVSLTVTEEFLPDDFSLVHRMTMQTHYYPTLGFLLYEIPRAFIRSVRHRMGLSN